MEDNGGSQVSINFFVISPLGFHEQHTIRSDNCFSLLEDKEVYQQFLIEQGYVPKEVGRTTHQPSEAPASKELEVAPWPPEEQEPALHTAKTSPSASVLPPGKLLALEGEKYRRSDSFIVEFIDYNHHKGKTYWKAFGDPYNQYGVKIWPETMIDYNGIDLDALPENAHFFQGVVRAYYTLNDAGNPGKVIRLGQEQL